MEFITSYDDIQDLIKAGEPFFIFKHSTQCPISASADKEFEEFLKEHDAPHCAVKVIEQRDISNTIADTTGVAHESPQAILMKGTDVLWHDSHQSLTKEEFAKQWSSHSSS